MKDPGTKRTQALPFRYSDEQRNLIAEQLRASDEHDADSLNATLGEIKILVRLTREALQYREEYPVDDWQQDEFRALNKPISQILKTLNRPAFEHLREFIPYLRTELNFLLLMVQKDQPNGRGKPPDPMTALHFALVERLAQIWAEHHHWPRRFRRFVHTCLDPADIQVSDNTVRKVIKKHGVK